MIDILLIAAVAFIGLLAFFEPCTIATHTLFGVRTHGEEANKRFVKIFNLLFSRTLLSVILLFVFIALFDKLEWKTVSPEIIFVILAAVYFISRYSYIPIPHIDFSFFLPSKLKEQDSIKLGVTLPACTIPLFIVVIGISLTVHTFTFALIAA
ncbi:Cytochrome c-type biogenesis protein CcdA (DsbD analog), partial [hydrothermal vent metagenome]